jgi:hypothetical protein
MSNYVFARYLHNRTAHGDQKSQEDLMQTFSKQINPTFIKVIEPLVWFLTQAK